MQNQLKTPKAMSSPTSTSPFFGGRPGYPAAPIRLDISSDAILYIPTDIAIYGDGLGIVGGRIWVSEYNAGAAYGNCRLVRYIHTYVSAVAPSLSSFSFQKDQDAFRPTPSTYGQRPRNTGHPVRSAIHKPLFGQLVMSWVTRRESCLLYVFACFHVST